MLKNKELLDFHLAKCGLDMEKDFLQPLTLLMEGDVSYQIRLREIIDRLNTANCSFDELGISNEMVSLIRKKGSTLYAQEISEILNKHPHSTLNPSLLIILEREMCISGLNLSSLSLSKSKLIELLPSCGDTLQQIPLGETRSCKALIDRLPD